MEKIKTDKATLRKFGLTMAFCFAVITLAIFVKHKLFINPTLIIALFFLIFAVSFPLCLKYLYIVWMTLAFILSWFNTRLLLGVIFYFIFAPVGLFMRLFKIDPLEIKPQRSNGSYWKPKEIKEISLTGYERQS